MRATSELRKEASQIEKSLTSGKITGPKKIKQAKARMQALRYHANRRDGIKKTVKKNFNPAQAFLPSFLSQMKNVGIEELLSERASKALRTQIAVAATKAAVVAFKKAK